MHTNKDIKSDDARSQISWCICLNEKKVAFAYHGVKFAKSVKDHTRVLVCSLILKLNRVETFTSIVAGNKTDTKFPLSNIVFRVWADQYFVRFWHWKIEQDHLIKQYLRMKGFHYWWQCNCNFKKWYQVELIYILL